MSLREYLKNIADTLRNWLNSDELINAQNFPEAINSACETQRNEGSNEGYVYGYDEGYWVGEEVGYSDGYNEGHEEGYIEGYHKGGLDYSPQETVSGEAIGIKDISPIEHNMGVKISGVDDISTVKLYKQGKNWLSNDVYEKNNWIYRAQGQSYTYNLQLSKGIYTISFDCVQQKGYFYLEYSTDDWETKTTTYLMTPNDLKQTHTFEVDEKKQWHLFWYFSSNWFADGYITNIQIELGNSATEYEPYIEPIMYDVPADGVVEGVTSLYPSTTLYTDTQGAVIDCTYYQDGKKVKENLTDLILSLGGVINE